MEFDGSVRIPAPPSQVYAVLADIQDRAVHPGSPVELMEKEPQGPTRVGTRWREVVRVAPLLRITMRSEVTEAIADRALAMTFHGASMRGHLRYTLLEDGPDTVLHQQETMHAGGWLRPLDALLGRRLEARLQRRLDELTALFPAAEGRHDPA